LKLAFTVPCAPVAANQAYKPARWGSRHGLVLTEAGASYKETIAFHARRALMKARIKANANADAYAVAITFVFRTRASDIDGPLKGTLDGLQAAGVFENDNRVRYVQLYKRTDKTAARVEIEVWSIDPEVL
jgi:Holliday junction resolvase RusA-like endonuclease